MWEGEVHNIKKDGTSFWCHASVSTLTRPDQGTIWIAVHQDITERRRAQDSLKLFRTLIDQSSDAIEVIDPETGRLLDVNEKACLNLGYSRDELLSLSVFDIEPTVDQALFRKVNEELRTSGSVMREGTHLRKNGSTFPVEVNIKYIQLDRGYVVTIVRDITERKRPKRRWTCKALRSQRLQMVLSSRTGRAISPGPTRLLVR